MLIKINYESFSLFNVKLNQQEFRQINNEMLSLRVFLIITSFQNLINYLILIGVSEFGKKQKSL